MISNKKVHKQALNCAPFVDFIFLYTTDSNSPFLYI